MDDEPQVDPLHSSDIRAVDVRRHEWPLNALLSSTGHIAGSLGPVRCINQGHCATFALSDHGLVARVGRPTSDSQARNAVRFGSLAGSTLRFCLRPASMAIDQPVLTEWGPVTFWPLLTTVDRQIDYRWFGAAIRSIHTLDVDWPETYKPTGQAVMSDRYERYSRAPNADARLLRQGRTMLEDIHRLKSDMYASPKKCLIHGDAYPVNIVHTPQQSFLLDYDTAGIGHPYWDLAPVLLAAKRFGLATSYVDEFFEGYGEDPRGSAELDSIVRIREMGIVTYLFEHAAHSKRYHRELRRRVDTFDDSSVPWATLEELGPPGNDGESIEYGLGVPRRGAR